MTIEEIKKEIEKINAELEDLLKALDTDSGDGDGDGGNGGNGDDGQGGSKPADDDDGNKRYSLEAIEKRAKELLSKKNDLKEQLKELEASAASRSNTRAKIAEGLAGTTTKRFKSGDGMTIEERAAQAFIKTGKMETRAILSTGKIAKPSKVGGINGLADIGAGIVDDVNAVALTGNGAWIVAYKKTDAAAADVTDGSEIGGTASTYDYVEINPQEWGVTDEISNQVKKMTPLDYQGAIASSALIALRAKACEKIITAVKASDLLESKTLPLDEKFIRALVTGFRSIAGKGAVKLYLNQEDLATLGAIRGTNEKLPVYEISFDDETNTSGKIQDGGTAVSFRVLDSLAKGEQLYGQPGAIDMPMWDNYTVETNDGGDYFKRNMIGIRGLQTANAGLAAYHGMQLIKQSQE